jgi:HAMP domain-containing protein
MARKSGSFWQDRVLRRRRMLTFRAKLVWTLVILLALSLVPVAGSLIGIHRARTEITGILRTAIDPSLLVDDVQLALAQSRLARFDYLFTGEPVRGEDAVAAASFVRFLIESGKNLWPYSPKEMSELQDLATRYEAATRDLVAEVPGPPPHLVLTTPEDAEAARRRFLVLRDEAAKAPTAADRERVLRQARQALLDLDDAVTFEVTGNARADSLLQSVTATENRLENLFHGVYSEATRNLTAERLQVTKDLSLAVRDLFAIIVVALILAFLVALTAPRWILRPIRRLTGLIHYARTGEISHDTGLPVSNDEVGRLTVVLEEHLRRDKEVESVRRRLHRASVLRLEALLESQGILAAGVAPGGQLAFMGRRLREALGIGGETSMAIPLEQVWPDEGLQNAVRELRHRKESEATVTLSAKPFAGRRATLVRTRTGEPANAEIIVLVPRDRTADSKRK